MRDFFSYPFTEVFHLRSIAEIIIVAFSVIASFIGAGFASGQEMLCYFVYLDQYGIIGIIVTAVFFTLFIYTVLSYSVSTHPKNFDEFLSVFKHNGTKTATKAIIAVFSFAVYGAMLSALGELIYDITGIPKGAGALICAVLSTVLFSAGIDKIFAFNGIIGICLVFLITYCCFYMLSYREYHVFSTQLTLSSINGMIYSGYNLVSLAPVLVSLSNRLKSRTDSAAASLSSGIMSVVIMSLIFCLLSIYAGKIELGALPMLTLAKRQNSGFAALYSTVLCVAIITTLLSSGGGLCNTLNLKNKPIYIALVSACAYLLSGLGFANLINTAYRICGIGGFFVCTAIIFSCIKHRNT